SINKKYKILGDLVICKAQIEKESKIYKKTLEERWAHIIIHGTLHLLGYDHKIKKKRKQMESIENKIMLSLEYTKPYIL
ncbi:MAG: rRNA maturation RNase YbeY, partial [Candidatus Blochmannia sp. A2]|nr:rRNA maturation RNase YbeY [Candidatus Blochmannia sp. A2]